MHSAKFSVLSAGFIVLCAQCCVHDAEWLMWDAVLKARCCVHSVNSGKIRSVVRGGSRAKIFYAHGPRLTMGLLFTLCRVGTRNPALCYKLGLTADTFARLQANRGVLRAARRVGPAKPECLQG